MQNDNLYFKNNFTKEDEKVNLDLNKLTIECINSKNNKFNLDSEGNLSVNSVTTKIPLASPELTDYLYPIGSIYMNVTDVNPETIYGGSWEKIENKFLFGSSPNYQLGNTGGEEKHLLNLQELPDFQLDVRDDINGHTVVNSAYPHEEGWGAFNQASANVSGSPLRIFYRGGNQPHNNMPPYLVVNIWKRIA